ncbi:MAG: AgmX/PglI C-terminal domain-containing protein, partial [Bdellovibrionales bacterium]
KGSVVEVMVAWNNRVLSSNHFKEKGSVFISSSDDADVMVPIISSTSRYELLKISTQVTVCLTQEMTGELIRDGETLTFADLARQNKLRNVGTHFEIDLRQGEMVRLGLQGDLVSIYVRYVADTPKPLVAPLLDMTSSEVTGIVLALAISAIMALYMNIYTPSPLLDDEARIDEPIRKAIVKFNPPTPKIVEVKDEPQEKKVVVAKDKPRSTPSPSVEKKGDPGKAGEVAPNQNKNKEKKLTSSRPGGAIKTAPKEGASAKSEKPDPSKVGLLGVFSSKGTQSKLDKAYSGSGELTGMADSATGYAGNAETRDGDNLGTKLKDTGAGGKGSATVGIAGVGTQGRGTGTTGYGTGGIGKKGSAQIHVDGQEGEFSTGMDKEAIRRVIREHIREIRSCYERELQRSPDLYGKLVLEWDIEEGGRVSRCVVKSNALGNETVANCISSRLKTWKFPDPPKDMVGRVSYPFVFSSQ